MNDNNGFLVVLCYFLPQGRTGRVFNKHIRLPFVPFPGLGIDFDEENSFTCEQVSYTLEDGSFTVIAGMPVWEEEDVAELLKLGFVEQLQPR